MSSRTEGFRLMKSRTWSLLVLISCTESSLPLISSSQARHAAPAVKQRLAQVLLDHVGRDFQPRGDGLVAHTVPVRQHDRGVALGWKLSQHFAQTLDACLLIDVRTKGWQV